MKVEKKRQSRLRRSRRTRAVIRRLGVPRLSVYRSAKHITAQVFSADGTQVIAACSSVEKGIREQVTPGAEGCDKKGIAALVGKTVAERANKVLQNMKVAFDRSGYPYHGRVKALAEAAREHGLQF